MKLNKKKPWLLMGILTTLCLSIPVQTTFALDYSKETLSTLGITVQSSQKITRGQFADLLFALTGSNSLSTGQSPFSDVPSTRSDAKSITAIYNLDLLSGRGDGTFAPDSPITLGEAVTSALRLLEYTSADIGYRWPEDYVAKGETLGLLDNVGMDGSSTFSQSQMESFLYNILGCSDSNGMEYTENLFVDQVEEVIILSQESQVAVLENGVTTYYTSEITVPSSFLGACRGTLLLNEKSSIVGFLPEENNYVEIDLSYTTAMGIFDQDGQFHTVQSATTVVLGDVRSTYGMDYFTLPNYTSAILYYDKTGKVDLILGRNNVSLDQFMVTGYYEDASPNPDQPTTVTVMGGVFEVEPDIAYKFNQFSLGQRLHLLLNESGKVENVMTYSMNYLEPQIGIYNGNTVTLSNGITLSGTTVYGTASSGQLVEVLPAGVGEWTISLPRKTTSRDLNCDKESGQWFLGEYPLSPQVAVYDSVNYVETEKISMDIFDLGFVSSSDIQYYRLNEEKEVDILLLNNANGNRFLYGILERDDTTEETLLLTNGDFTMDGVSQNDFEEGEILGIYFNSAGNVQEIAELSVTSSVNLTAFDGDRSLSVDDITIPLSEEVTVYQPTYDSWISLSTAFAECKNFVAYYDKTPEDGRKVRIIFAY
ncbi:MAG: S-layer homology domain-containing protein [Eubacteriales bacterium]